MSELDCEVKSPGGEDQTNKCGEDELTRQDNVLSALRTERQESGDEQLSSHPQSQICSVPTVVTDNPNSTPNKNPEAGTQSTQCSTNRQSSKREMEKSVFDSPFSEKSEISHSPTKTLTETVVCPSTSATVRNQSDMEESVIKGGYSESSPEMIMEDDSDSQWTDISDDVTEDEDESIEQHEGARGKHSFSSTPVKSRNTSGDSTSLSDEERQNYAFISRQLSILNEESCDVNTDKRPKKDVASRHKVRTPRKQLAPRTEIEERFVHNH